MSSINKGVFYGTGAAEGIPDPFCRCYLCEYARKHGGKDVRTRSMFRVSKEMTIDLGPDVFLQSFRWGDLVDLEHVLITHTHEDHFAPMVCSLLKMATARPEKPVNYYLVGDAFDVVPLMRGNKIFMKGALGRMEEDGLIVFHQLQYGQEYTIGDCKVVPLRGHHFGNMGENSANYLIYLQDGKCIYYGLDTGKYEQDTIDYLKNCKVDILVSECTFGNAEDTYYDPGHLSYTTCIEMIEKLRAQNTLAEDCQIYLTHINHLHTAYHEKLQKMFNNTGLPYRFQVAYDGMQIEL